MVANAAPEYRYLDLDDLSISESNVRRRDITVDLDELARSMDKHDLQQPVVVQRGNDGKYEIIIGQRRYLAAKQLGWKRIAAKILPDHIDEVQARVLSFSENIQRHDISPRDKADVCRYLFNELGSVSAVARELGTTEKTVRKWLGYDVVPSRLKALVETGELNPSRAIRLAENIPDEDTAVAVAREMARIKPTREEEARIFAAAEAFPDRPVEVILQRAEEMREQVEIHFILPPEFARPMANAARESRREPSDIARDATIEWLRQHQY